MVAVLGHVGLRPGGGHLAGLRDGTRAFGPSGRHPIPVSGLTFDAPAAISLEGVRLGTSPWNVTFKAETAAT